MKREKVYFIRGEGIFMTFFFLFIIFNFKRDIVVALNDVIYVRTIRHINEDVA